MHGQGKRGLKSGRFEMNRYMYHLILYSPINFRFQCESHEMHLVACLVYTAQPSVSSGREIAENEIHRITLGTTFNIVV